MRTFVAALVFASVYAQETEEATLAEQAEDSWSSVKNWFASTTQEYLTTQQKYTPFGSYVGMEGYASMNSVVSLDFTAIGTNFVTVTMNLTHTESSYFAENTRGMVYFQIEEPAEDDHDHRLLQDEPNVTVEEFVTGTGHYEGWYCYAKWGARGVVENMADYNLWGTVPLMSQTRVTAANPAQSSW